LALSQERPPCFNYSRPGQVYHWNTFDKEWRCGKCVTEFTTAKYESHQATNRADVEKIEREEYQEYLDRIEKERCLFHIASYEWYKQLKEMFGEICKITGFLKLLNCVLERMGGWA